jgi:Domain of unknown function (DUF4384)
MSLNIHARQLGLTLGVLILAFCAWGVSAPASMTVVQSPSAAPQQGDDDEQERQLFAKEFLQARPTPGQRRTPRTPRANADQTSAMLGITVWRLRPADKKDDTQARLLEQEADSEVVLIGERVGLDTTFQEGQKVRLGVESPRTGYLYVIDREQYADGTYSEPYLIFPTLKTRDGENAVAAGRLIEIPDQDDHPFYFKMNRHRPDQQGEVLTFVVTTQPIPNLQLGRKALKLTNEQFAQWEQRWKAPARRVEMANHAGKTYTKVEMSAGSNKTALLGRDDPPPQTIFRITGKPGEALMITVPLRYAAPTAK